MGPPSEEGGGAGSASKRPAVELCRSLYASLCTNRPASGGAQRLQELSVPYLLGRKCVLRKRR
jgi:hypothetical protein